MSEVRDQPSDEQDEKKRSRASKNKVLKEARERFEAIVAADRENKDAALEDTKFVYLAGAQWPDAIIKSRRDAGEPCLEFPQLKQYVKAVVNDQRQKRPGIRVHPAGGDASKEVAEIIQGMIRGIEYDSQAEAAYDTAFEHAVVGGRGYWRICSDFERPDSFNQVLKIERIADTSMVWLDLDYNEPDGSDRRFGFVAEKVAKDEFKQRWPKAQPLDWDGGEGGAKWFPSDEEVLVADYYRRIAVDDTLLLLSDGSTKYLSDMPSGVALPPGVSVVNERSTTRYKVEWFKIAGGEQVLEEYEWKGTIIPVVCAMGDEVIVEGKRTFHGLIRQARDAQRMYNYEQSAKAQRLALAPKAPWVGPAAAFSGYEQIWKTANKLPHTYLPYNHVDEELKPIPAPQRTPPAPVEGGWIEAANQSKADIKSVLGMYENTLGMQGQETSGRAILAREKQGDNATFHFVDNLGRAIALTGRIIVELIPYYYDTHRMVTIVGIDDSRELQAINQPQPAPDPATGAITAILQNNVTSGQFAVTVEAGPSYATKRAETQDFITQLVQAYPPLMQVAGDLMVGAMDFAESDQVAERLKATLPPPIQQMLGAKDQGQDPRLMALQQQMQQMQQQAQQAVQTLQQQLQQAGAQVQQMKQQLQAKSDQAAASMHVEELKTHAAEIKANADIFKAFLPLLQNLAAPQIAQDAQILAPAANQAAGVLGG